MMRCQEAYRLGVPFTEEQKTIYRRGTSMKKHAKLAIFMDWILEQVVDLYPDDPAALKGHAEMISEKIKSKNVKVPAYIDTVLEGMKVPDADRWGDRPGAQQFRGIAYFRGLSGPGWPGIPCKKVGAETPHFFKGFLAARAGPYPQHPGSPPSPLLPSPFPPIILKAGALYAGLP